MISPSGRQGRSTHLRTAAESPAVIGDLPASLSGLRDHKIEHVSDASLGEDDSRRTRIVLKLASQTQDLHVDAAVGYVLIYPGCLQEVLAA